MLLSEAIESLAIATRVAGRSDRTVQGYREKLAYLLEYLGDVDVSSITTDDLRRFIASLMDRDTLFEGHPTRKARKGKLSPYTVQSYTRHVKRLFSWLVQEGRLESNPAARIPVRKPKTHQVKAISRQDLLAILETTEGDRLADKRDRAVLLLLADSGARAGGICGLRLQDLDMAEGTARVIEKGGASRFVYFTDTTAEALRGWLKVRPDRGDWLFTGLRSYAKDRMSPNSLRQMIRRRADRAGVTGNCGPHAFRHAFAIAYLMAGGDLASLSRIMGHSSVQVTADYYGAFTRRQLQEKHARHSPITQMFGGDGGDGAKNTD